MVFTPLINFVMPYVLSYASRQPKDKLLVVEHQIRKVTPEMIHWWWAHMDNSRYKQWHPYHHISFAWLTPPKKTHIGSVHFVRETIGGYTIAVRIRFDEPSGSSFPFVVAASVLDDHDSVVMQFTHEYEPAPNGTHMRSTFYMPALLHRLLHEDLRHHNQQEMANFSKFLPDLYAKHAEKISSHDITAMNFDTAGWTHVKSEASQILWVNEYRDIAVKRFHPHRPSDLMKDHPNMDSMRRMFTHMAEMTKGVLVSVDRVDVQGVECFQVIMRHRMERNPLGMVYLGSLMFPFTDCYYHIQFQCEEHGTTGTRAAVVTVTHPEFDKMTPKEPPRMVKSMDEFFSEVSKAPLKPHFSDNPEYDEMFPDHPVSRCRRYLRHAIETLTVTEALQKTEPYRYRPEDKLSDVLSDLFKD